MTDIPISPPRTWAEICISHVKHNLNVARRYSKNRIGGIGNAQQMMAVLKAGAYGHGLERMALALEDEDLAYYGVASVIEARRLKEVSVQTPIYLLGPTFPDERAEIVTCRWTPSLSSIEEAEHFNQLNIGNPPLEVHLTLDTGMGRGGFLTDGFDSAMEAIEKLPHLEIVGIGSHLPSADVDDAFTYSQFAVFEEALLEKKVRFTHLSNSAGLLRYKQGTTNLARPGLMLYGISPFGGKNDFQEELRPVMTLKSRVSVVRTLPAGHGVSYGRTAILERATRVATVGAGYGDGYPRAVSGRGAEVIIRGVRCPLLGRVTMDQMMVDVSHLPDCESGDEVELFGPNLLVSELAEKAETIPWEILTRITTRVTRVYL